MKQSYRNFEDTFRLLLKKAKARRVSLRTMLTILSGKGKVLLIIFLSLGFGQIPGISIILGLVIASLGVRIAFGSSSIWMPKFLLNKKIPSYFLTKVIQQILKFLKFMKRWSHPRYIWATQHPVARVMNGIVIALAGLSFAICPPIPFTSLTACLGIFAIGIGLLNDDGIYILIGYICSIIYFVTVFYCLKFFSITQLVEWIQCLSN